MVDESIANNIASNGISIDLREIQARDRTAGVKIAENLPFLFEPARPNNRALLLVHGFSASPYEMRWLGSRLCDAGYLCLGVRLAGHGTTPEDLRGQHWQDWQLSVDNGFALLQRTALPIDLLAQSTGALLGLNLLQHRNIRRAVLLSPYLWVRHPLGRIAGLIRHLVPYQHRTLPHPDRLHYYERRPLAAVAELGRLARHVQPHLKEIQTPILALAAAQDQTVSDESGRKLFEALGSPEKHYHRFGPDAPHDLGNITNPYFEEVFNLTRNFLLGEDS